MLICQTAEGVHG